MSTYMLIDNMPLETLIFIDKKKIWDLIVQGHFGLGHFRVGRFGFLTYIYIQIYL